MCTMKKILICFIFNAFLQMGVKVLREALMVCYMELLCSPFIIQLMGKKKKVKITTTCNKKESFGLCGLVC